MTARRTHDPLRVVAIEDNLGDVRLIREALEEDGRVVVEVALDGRSGMDLVGNGDGCDLVLLDINLPGLSGLELVSWIRSSEGADRIPIVMFTSSNLVEDVREAERRGADMFVVKPFDVREYLSVLRQIRRRFLEEQR